MGKGMTDARRARRLGLESTKPMRKNNRKNTQCRRTQFIKFRSALKHFLYPKEGTLIEAGKKRVKELQKWPPNKDMTLKVFRFGGLHREIKV